MIIFTPYDNQADIDELQRMVEAVCPGLQLRHFRLECGTNFVTSVGITLDVAGNKKNIEKLKLIGFKELRKRKKQFFVMHAGYSMVVDMCMTMPEPPKEDNA